VLALAIEALRDRAIEMRERYEARVASEPPPGQAAAADQWTGDAPPFEGTAPMLEVPALVASTEMAVTQQLPSPQPAQASGNPYQLIGDPRDEGERQPRPDPTERTLKVKPRLYFSLYGGASAESRAFRTGVGTGGGLCVRGQCLLLGIEYPLPFSLEQGADDVRYRYPTFSCTFHSQPLTFGRFAPAVSVGVLSRVGHFERDMGLKNYLPGLDTDLGVRGTIEGAFEVIEAVDVVAQAGVDYALDRWQYGETSRGSRTAPWLQAGIRVRPE
jgi:hypothetical protein